MKIKTGKRMVRCILLCHMLLVTGCGSFSGRNGTTMAEETETTGSMDTEYVQTVTEDETVVDTEASLSDEADKIIEQIENTPAGTVVDVRKISGRQEELFYQGEIEDIVFARMNGVSYQENTEITREELRYLRCLYTGGDGNTYVGEMVVNQKIADIVIDILYQLYQQSYPIERMVLIDTYDGDDEASMLANNTSAFNYRKVAGSTMLSNHSYGLAIDLNPYYNPYVKDRTDGSRFIQPEAATAFADRSTDFSYKIDENDLAYQLFTQAGFTWGGSWNSVKDYQHFEYAR